jgi:hypothetical protein
MTAPHADRDHSEQPVDLLAALQRSIEQAREHRGARGAGAPAVEAWELEDGDTGRPFWPSFRDRDHSRPVDMPERSTPRGDGWLPPGATIAVFGENVGDAAAGPATGGSADSGDAAPATVHDPAAERLADVQAEHRISGESWDRQRARLNREIVRLRAALSQETRTAIRAQQRREEFSSRAEAAERALADERAKVAQHESTIRALTTRVNVAEPKLDAWRSWGRQRGYGLTPEEALAGPEPDTTEETEAVDESEPCPDCEWRDVHAPGCRRIFEPGDPREDRLRIDFQIQQRTRANEQYPAAGKRHPLGIYPRARDEEGEA